MKKLLLLTIIVLFHYQGKAQLVVNYHRSYLHFIGVNYQIGRFIPQFRIAIPAYRFESNTVESETAMQAGLNYLVLIKEKYQLYRGLGTFYRKENTNLGVTGGLNTYPFKRKNFGLHFEATAFFNKADILHGGAGIQYRFAKRKQAI